MSSTLGLRHKSGHRPSNPTGRLAAEHPGLVKFGRLGWFAKGIVYVIAGVLALTIALAASGWSDTATGTEGEASPTGALRKVAEMSAGPLMLWLLAFGLFLYAIWRLVSAALPGGSDTKAIVHRIGFVVSAVIYGSLGVTAISLAQSKPTDDGNAQATGLTNDLMDSGFGRALVAIAGLAAIGAGIYRMVKGVKVDVDDELDMSGMSPERALWTRRLGAVGEFGRGIGIALVGFFLLRAAIDYNANEATGLDGALRRLADSTWGLVVIAIIGIGFVAYGLFCLVTFNRRRLQAP